MNERIRIIIDHMRTRAALPLRAPVQALEIPGPGRSVLVALWFGTEPEGDAAPLCGVALLTPSDRQPGGWLLVEATTGAEQRSPGGAITVMAALFVCGQWVIAGRLVDPRATALSIRLRDGREMTPVMRDHGFLLLADAFPLPIEVRVLTGDTQILEQFRVPEQVPSAWTDQPPGHIPPDSDGHPPWVSTAVTRFRAQLRARVIVPLWSRDPVSVLGEVDSWGQSKIVALAGQTRTWLRRVTVIGFALVAPFIANQWSVLRIQTTEGTPSPNRTIDLHTGVFCGWWVIAGRLVDPRAAALSIRLRDGREMAPVVHDRGFLLTVAADPLPFDVRVLTDEAQLLERFRAPLRG
jgi:hypothetical protein